MEAGRMAGRWMDVAEAARELGISTDAVRKRIARGSLESARENGTVRVWLDDGGTEAGREAKVDGGPLVESLRDQVAYLREIVATRDEEIRRRDVIISQLTQRIPEIEAAPEQRQPQPAQQEPAEAREEAAQQPAPRKVRVGYPPSDTEAQTGSERAPWWRRWFGG